MSKNSNRRVSLSANAAAFDAALLAASTALPPVETTVDVPASIEGGTVSVDVIGENEIIEAVEKAIAEGDAARGDEEPVARRYMTMGVGKGNRVNGVGSPAFNGKCHAAWRAFDALVTFDGDVALPPSLDDCIKVARETGAHSPGNMRVEYPNWRKWNGFAPVARKAKVVAAPPVADAIVSRETIEAPEVDANAVPPLPEGAIADVDATTPVVAEA